jgi:hypothetical protein
MRNFCIAFLGYPAFGKVAQAPTVARKANHFAMGARKGLYLRRSPCWKINPSPDLSGNFAGAGLRFRLNMFCLE